MQCSGELGANVLPASASVPGNVLWLLPHHVEHRLWPTEALSQDRRAVALGGIFVWCKDVGHVDVSQALFPQS